MNQNYSNDIWAKLEKFIGKIKSLGTSPTELEYSKMELERLRAELKKAQAETEKLRIVGVQTLQEEKKAKAEVEKLRTEVARLKAEAGKTNTPSFKTVKIGSQVWTAENLALTKDRDGNELVLGKDYFYPNGDEKNVAKYGLLYTWNAAMRIAPNGWHLPTDDEWKQLIDYVSSQREYVCGGDSEKIGKALASTMGWNSSTSSYYAVGNTPSTNNATGFGVMPAGGKTAGLGDATFLWSATEFNRSNANGIFFYKENDYVNIYETEKDSGWSVRCLRN